MKDSRKILDVPEAGMRFDDFMDSLLDAKAPRLVFRHEDIDHQPDHRELNLATGTICTTWAPGSSEYGIALVVEASADFVQIVPAAFSTDLLVDHESHFSSRSVGFDFTGYTWARGNILREQCVEVLGNLESDELETFQSTLADTLLEADGVAIGSHAWRHIAQLSDTFIPYFRPAALLRESTGLGSLLNRALPLSDTTAEEAAEKASISQATWKAFESDQVNPAETISTRFLAELLREVGLFASERLNSLARNSVLSYGGSAVQPTAALARRRRNIRPKPSGQDAETAKRFAAKLDAELRS